MAKNPSVLAVGGKPVSEFRLVPFGHVRTDGAVSGGDFFFTRAHAGEALQWFAKVGRKLKIDYDHQSFAKLNPRPDGLSPAAGWVGSLEIRDDGLYCLGVEWTEQARTLLSGGEYLYFSPVIWWSDDANTHLTSLGPVALSNDPAMCGCAPLVASRIGGTAGTHTLGKRNPITALIGPMVGLGAEASVDQIVNALTDDNRARVAATLGLPENASDGEIRMALTDEKDEKGAKGGGGNPAGGGATPNPRPGNPTIGAKELAGKLGLSGVETEEQLVSVLTARLKPSAPGIDPSEYAKLVERLAVLEKNQADGEFATICDSGAGKGKITPALRESMHVLFRANREAFDKAVAAMPVQVGGESVFAGSSQPGTGGSAAPDRVALIAGARQGFRDEKGKGKTVLCSERAWVNDTLRTAKLEPLSADEVKKDNISIEAA